MSDPNDKKPQSPASSWSDPDRQTRDKANAGPVMEDPLAELDRIVSGGFGHETGQQSGASVSADDLRSLEEELIRELRGHQQDVGDLAPASPATRQAPQVDVPQDDSMVRPHPLSQNRPGVQAQPTVPAASRETQDPRGYVPEAPVYREPEVRAEPFETEARRSAPEPSVGNDATRSSGLDDWSSLFDDLGPAASSASTAGGRRDERIDPYPQEPTDRDDGLPTSGSYGQLSRRAAPKVDMREEEDAYQAADSESQAPDVVADDLRYAQPPKQPSYDKGSYAAAKPDYRSSLGADREPEVDPMRDYRPGTGAADVASGAVREAVMPSSWSNQRHQEEPVSDPMSGYRANAPAVGGRDVPYGAAPQSSRYAPEVSHQAPSGADLPGDYYPESRREPSGAYDDEQGMPGSAPRVTPEDPYAAFNDPNLPASSQPYRSYAAPSVDRPRAPNVNVAGQIDDYASYGSGPSYRDAAPQSYDQGYAAGQGGYADTPVDPYDDNTESYGTYADPNVAQADAESLPNYQDEDYTTLETAAAMAAPQPKRKSRKGLYVATAAGLVIVVGGLLAWGFGQSGNDSTETPVIEANADPVKETPEDPGGIVVPNQDQTVYDRIDGSASDEGPSNLMPATEKPLDMTADGQSPRVIPLSGGEASVSQSATDAGTESGAVAPKRVRTVVVRPDGTFVTSSEPTAAPEQQPAQATNLDQQMMDLTPSEQAMTQTYNTDVNGSSLNGAAAQPVVDANMPLPKSKPAELEALQAAAQSSAPQVTQPVAVPVVPQSTSQAPLVLAPPAAIPTQQAVAAPSSGGGYTVQVTSQRTPEQAQASYRNIQAQLSSVLAGYEPDIKRADLGARGTYYRVRVGSFPDQAGAINFCNSIKNAGGDCLVARQ